MQFPESLKTQGGCPCPVFFRVLKHAFETIFIFDRNYRVLFVNRLQQGAPEEAIGTSVLARIHPEYRQKMKGEIDKHWKKMHPFHTTSVTIDGRATEGKIVPITQKIAMSLVRFVEYRPVLTERERMVFQMVRKGLSSKSIAERLHIAVSSVSVHRKQIKKKLGFLIEMILLQTSALWLMLGAAGA